MIAGRPTAAQMGANIAAAGARDIERLALPGPATVAEAVSRVQRRLRSSRATTPEPASLARAVGRLIRGETLRRHDALLCASGVLVSADLDGRSVRIADRPQHVRALRAQLRRHMGASRTGRRVAANLAAGLAHSTARPAGPAARGAILLGSSLVEWVRSNGFDDDPRFAGVMDAESLFIALDAAPFAAFVADGTAAAWKPLDALEVPANGWVRLESIRLGLAQALDRDDASLRRDLDRLLDVLDAHEDVADEGLGAVLGRWAHLAAQPEHVRLRDTAIARWGSPLREDSHGEWRLRAGEDARAMVARWLTRRAITAFFQLAGGPGTDQERLDFWMQYADHIESFRLYLGMEGRRQLKASRAGLGTLLADSSIIHSLTDGLSRNAFMMTIGGYHFVEFSEKGNALYVYEKAVLPPAFAKQWASTSALKDQGVATERLLHYPRWQPKAARVVHELTGRRPIARR